MKSIVYNLPAGGTFDYHAKEAINLAKRSICRDMQPVEVRFMFNELEIVAYSSSDWKDICRQYDLKCALRRAKLGYQDDV